MNKEFIINLAGKQFQGTRFQGPFSGLFTFLTSDIHPSGYPHFLPTELTVPGFPFHFLPCTQTPLVISTPAPVAILSLPFTLVPNLPALSSAHC